MIFRSPNELMEAAKEYMLQGRSPESREDWMLVMNFMAANIQWQVAEIACIVLAQVYQMPLSREEVKKIVAYQLNKREEVRG